MNFQQLAMTAALSMVTTDALATHGSKGDPKHSRPVDVEQTTRFVRVDNPVWPDNGIAERILGDGDETWPENMFVEVAKGKLHAWVLMSPVQGQAKALDFFSGEVQDIEVEKPGEYNESFVDENGVLHRLNAAPIFRYKDSRPGGRLAGIDFYGASIDFNDGLPCSPYSLYVSQRMNDRDRVIGWRKVPLYKTISRPERCPRGVWNSFVNTALDLRDGTMLITASKYIFRIRIVDMAPIGDAPHLNVVNAEDVERVAEDAKREGITDLSAYMTEKLDLH